jgi:hypothetical protein
MVDVTLTPTVTLAVGAAVVVVPDVEATPAVAVTSAVREVVRTVRAIPVESLFATDTLSVPVFVVNVTGTPVSAFPPESFTAADTVDEPPVDGSDSGDALITIPATAAEPMAIFIAPVVPAVTPPEIALIVAVPEPPPAMNVVIARPLTSVSTSAGCKVPRFVENDTSVPE